jgi:hypothetical protein
MDVNNINLTELPQLSVLFRSLTSGKHLSRSSDPILWYELEKNTDVYIVLFKALNYKLEVDARGFAWFANDELTATMNTQSRKLALFFLVLFDYQADTGQSLGSFLDWKINSTLLENAYPRHKELLSAEQIEQEDFIKLPEIAARNGFMVEEFNYWKLLPPAYRYLDHFESIVDNTKDKLSEIMEDLEQC